MSFPTDSRRRGLAYILGATVVAGGCGYLIQLAAPALLEDVNDYLAFTVFWSTLYLFASAISGLQQEVTRATRPTSTPQGGARLGTFAVCAALTLAVAAVGVGVSLSSTAFSSAPTAMTVWFAVGLVGYLLISILAGVLYGLEIWSAIGLLIMADPIVRVVLLAFGFTLDWPAGVLSALISIPFLTAVAIVWLLVRRRVVGRFQVDVGILRLSTNAMSTMLGAAAMGVLVTGLPLLLRTSLPDAAPEYLASLILVITVTRAPLIIPLMSLQSYLVVEFRRGSVHVWGMLTRYLLALAVLTAVLAAAAWAWGPQLIGFISVGRFAVEPAIAAIVIVSAGLVAAMCITGPALLAAAKHFWFVAGWLLAAVATVAALLVPADVQTRIPLALLLAPALGVAVHALSVRPSKARS